MKEKAAVVLRRLPCDIVETNDTEVDLHLGILWGSLVILDDVVENLNIMFERCFPFVQIRKSSVNCFGVVLNLGMKTCLGLMHKMAMMSTLLTSF